MQHGPKLSLYLFELMHDHKDELTKEEQISVGAFMNTLKLCGYKYIPLNAPPKPDLIKAMEEVCKSIEYTLSLYYVYTIFAKLDMGHLLKFPFQ